MQKMDRFNGEGFDGALKLSNIPTDKKKLLTN